MIPDGTATRWFEIHSNSCIESHSTRGISANYLDWYKNATIPIYMQRHFDEIPASVEYPLAEMVRHFGRQYFKSTLDYMIALALFEGFTEIHIYGVNMAVGEEYSVQKPSMEYWLGRAEGMGVKIVLPDGCDLLKGYFRYGYDDEKQNDLLIKGRAKSAELAKNAAEFQKNYYLSMGAKAEWDFILRELGENV